MRLHYFHTWEEFFCPDLKAHKKCGENGEKGFMHTKSWFKPIFLIFLIRLLRNLKLPIPMVDFAHPIIISCRSQWPRGLRRGSAAPRLLRLWVRILSGAWMSVCCECCVLSGRGLCDGLITRPEESYRTWCD
jgi:hypothetical protein